MAATAFIPLTEAAKLIPGSPHVSTCHRWAIKGVNGVKLRTKKAGNRKFTKPEWIEEFLAELNKSDSERLAEEGA